MTATSTLDAAPAARASMLVVLDRARLSADRREVRTLREDLADWYVIACGVEDLAAAVRAFEVRFVLIVGGAQLVADTFAELERTRYAPERFAVVPDVARARRAVGAPGAGLDRRGGGGGGGGGGRRRSAPEAAQIH